MRFIMEKGNEKKKVKLTVGLLKVVEALERRLGPSQVVVPDQRTGYFVGNAVHLAGQLISVKPVAISDVRSGQNEKFSQNQGHGQSGEDQPEYPSGHCPRHLCSPATFVIVS